MAVGRGRVLQYLNFRRKVVDSFQGKEYPGTSHSIHIHVLLGAYVYVYVYVHVYVYV